MSHLVCRLRSWAAGQSSMLARFPRFAAAGSASPGRISRCLTRRLHTAQAHQQVQTNAHSPRLSSDLIELFDTQLSTTSSLKAYPTRPVGLLYHPLLTERNGFLVAAERTLIRAKQLVDRIVSAEDATARRQVVKMMDQLSDELCSIMDIAEFVRMAHPDEAYRSTAHQAYSQLFEFMNTLNTHPELYYKLREVLEDPAISRDFTPVEKQVAVQFLTDFEKSGIHLPESQRHSFVSLSNKVLHLGHQFLTDASSRSPTAATANMSARFVTVKSQSDLQGLPTSVVNSLDRATPSSPLRIPVPSTMGNMLVSLADSETVRRDAYTAQNHVGEERVQVLEDMLSARLSLARLTGQPSYGHMFLADKMAQTPDNVQTFLKNLTRSLQPQVTAELEILLRVKQQHSAKRPSATEQLQAWDKDYCMRKARSSAWGASAADSRYSLHGYFTVGNVMDGLSQLFQRLYGVTFRPGTIAAGEVWHPDVRKLEVVDEAAGGLVLGTIYCDLLARPAKAFNGAAHFTVRCARRIDDDVVITDTPTAHAPEQVRTDAQTGQQFQRPMVVLVCNFEPSSTRSATASLDAVVLSLHDLETLFHEMGHAMHSMFAQTHFHNVAGTRCAIDFVELPSILMERFAHDHRVLQLFARHYETGEMLPREVLEHHLARRQQFIGMETASQILMSILDQCYHSQFLDTSPAAQAFVASYFTNGQASTPSTPQSHFTNHMLQMLQNAGPPLSVTPYVPGVNWQVTIGHLFGYGAGYYAYLFDRVLAGRIWTKTFAADPLSREAGETYRTELLQWGGGRDPWACIGHVLADPILLQGDHREAMAQVGRWGLQGF
ncbi:Mitochondrial intermediate peptidase [Dimargaris verticillata]|uniref:mitochondrial intermediate peptidase n=1 Tax=Dimargaris verticillata TaxID=2761393 RepID=A0A9W8B5U3_9FUNG|nr:Mitochondrial intermediate peptidase [Dimargaris verticillata]